MKKSSRKFNLAYCGIALILIAAAVIGNVFGNVETLYAASGGDYIKWVDFSVTQKALSDAYELDVSTYGSGNHISWIDSLSYLGAKYGGEFTRYKKADLTAFAEKITGGQTVDEITSGMKLFSYYRQAYGAVLSGMVGEYSVYELVEGEGVYTEHYGLKAFYPIAYGYGVSDYDDFGDSRSFGYRRRHLGHDMLGSVGTPIIAVESGYVEVCGWNIYGGWRIGIRSFDGTRYWYYAHLRKGHPYCDIYEGKIVTAGEVIGYLGMTGYSSKEDTNNINVPHLHIGLQLIFDPVQKDGTNQIWIDMYALTKFLYRNRSKVYKNTESGEYLAVSPITDFSVPD